MAVSLVVALLLSPAGFTEVDGSKHPFAAPQPAVLIFALAECPILRGYVPELKRLGARRGVRFFLVQTDGHMKKAEALAFNREYSLHYIPVIDKNHALVKRFQVEAVPTAVVLDRQGHAAYVGRIDDRYPQLGVQRLPRTRDLSDALDKVIKGLTIKRRTPVVGCAVPSL
ncbi:hypothetical protein BH11ARM2_BH11ARM2_39110 [soil metagenome]